MKLLYWIVVLVAGYVLGSLSFSIILSKVLGRDIRKEGSGNAGATNMTRVFGWAAGVSTLAFDFLKAFAAMKLGQALLGDVGICLGGIASMTGHCFPVFHDFKGGKGIATGAAVGLMIDWRVFVCIVAVFLLVSLLTKKSIPRFNISRCCYCSGNSDFCTYRADAGAGSLRHGSRDLPPCAEHPPPAERYRAGFPCREEVAQCFHQPQNDNSYQFLSFIGRS